MNVSDTVIEETNRVVSIERVPVTFEKDRRFGFWSIEIGGKRVNERFTKFLKGIERAEQIIAEMPKKELAKLQVNEDEADLIEESEKKERIPRAKRSQKTRGNNEFLFSPDELAGEA